MIHPWLEAVANVPFFSTPAFGILAMLIVGSSWCLIGFVMGDAPKRGIEPSIVQLFGAIFSCVASLIIMVASDSVPHCSWRILLLTCGCIGVGGFMNFFMLQIMSYAMQRGPNGVIWSVIQSALVFPFIGGIVFFDVQLTVARGFGILCLLAALILFACTKDNSRSRSGWRIPALICLVIAAIQQNLTTAPSYFQEARAVNSITRALAAGVGALLAALIYDLVQMNREHWRKIVGNLGNPVLWRYVLALQFFSLLFAYTLFYPGMNAMADAGLGGMCYPMMVGSCIVSFSITAVVILKEKMTFLQLGALLVCVCGLVLICMPAPAAGSGAAEPPIQKIEKDSFTTQSKGEALMLKIPDFIRKYDDAYAPSALYSMRLNGAECPVRKCRVSAHPFNRVWPGHQRSTDQAEEAGYAFFAGDGPVDVEISTTLAMDKPPVILPRSAGINVTVSAGKISFRLPKPGQYILCPGSRHHALHIFFDPVKEYPESRSATYFFGPGVHYPGLLNLKSGDSVYVDRNAIVFTSIVAKHAENIRIYGGGVIDGSAEERISGACYPDNTKSIRFYFCKNIRIEDVIVLNSPTWSISTYCSSEILIDRVKIVGQWRYNTDGIDLCNSQHAKILNSFVRSFDDSIVLKGIDYRVLAETQFAREHFGTLYDGWTGNVNVEDIEVRSCVLWCDWGRTLEVGLETAAPEMKDILFEDCDLVHNTAAALDIQHGDYAQIHDVTFRNIRVEIQADQEASIHQKSDDQVYDARGETRCPMLIFVGDYRFVKESPWGGVRDILFDHIEVLAEPGVREKLPVCILKNAPGATFGRIAIRDLRVNGKVLRDPDDVDAWGGDLSLVTWEND